MVSGSVEGKFSTMLVLVFVWVCASASVVSVAGETIRTCEPVRVEMCKVFGYNFTAVPNLVGHELQSDAEVELQTFLPLIQYGCSQRLHLFLCTVYAPLCTEKVPSPIGPCRPLCEGVRARCQPVLQEFGFPWPAALNCSNFPPENNLKDMCVFFDNDKPLPTEMPTVIPITSGITRSPSEFNCNQYRKPNSFVFINRTGRCAALCTEDVLFSREDKHLMEIWLSVWATVSGLSTLFAVLSFLLDPSRFRYPERPVVFVAAAHLMQAGGWLLRATAGRGAVVCSADVYLKKSLLAQDGLSNATCALVFLSLYYFGTASAVWWAVLCLSWWLAAGMRWGHDALRHRASLFHLAGWGLPGIQTVVALVLKAVDADELTGTCSVGHQDTRWLLHLVIVPLTIYLAVGSVFLLAGFISLMRSRGHVSSVEPAVVRVGIFAVLYTIPSTCVLASLLYEYLSRDTWLFNNVILSSPALEVFMVRVFMALVGGVTCAMWIGSTKTLRSWIRLFRVTKKVAPPHKALVAPSPQPPPLLTAPGHVTKVTKHHHHHHAQAPLLIPPTSSARSPRRHKHRKRSGNETVV